MISLSLVFPLFNQESNLPKLFVALEDYIRKQNYFALEVVFVDDGSTDNTYELVFGFVEKHKEYSKFISYEENKGRGYALRQGMLEVNGDWRLVLDPDLSASLEEIEKLIPFINKGCQMIIGSRYIQGSHVETPPSLLRGILGRSFIFLSNLILGLNVSDVSCGFKCFSKASAQLILPKTKIDRWAHDAENLYLAKKYKVKVCEVPLLWTNGQGTTIRVFRAVAQSFYDLLMIPFIHRKD